MPVGTTSITHCSRLPVPEGRYQMTRSWPNDSPVRSETQRLSNASPGSVLQKLKFSLSWLNAGLGRASPFLAQDTGFSEPGHGQHRQRVWPGAPSRATENWRWFYQEAGQPTAA
ncbi:hypothetical protein D623_10024350 [Myotis brandtii]|uniref:Uncharacterized protein n=1 Tax=Myotis brandtii TaxID=109478 RepID=S7Q6X4_MYOBR|nr:hypothetical protein D623_10024350 [Myotis brandtii]